MHYLQGINLNDHRFFIKNHGGQRSGIFFKGLKEKNTKRKQSVRNEETAIAMVNIWMYIINCSPRKLYKMFDF